MYEPGGSPDSHHGYRSGRSGFAQVLHQHRQHSVCYVRRKIHVFSRHLSFPPSTVRTVMLPAFASISDSLCCLNEGPFCVTLSLTNRNSPCWVNLVISRKEEPSLKWKFISAVTTPSFPLTS